MKEARIRRRENYVGVIRSGHGRTMKDLRRSGRRNRAPDADRTQEQGTRHSQDAQDVWVSVLAASGCRALKNPEWGHNVVLKLRPDSRLTFCLSGVSDPRDAQDTRYFFC